MERIVFGWISADNKLKIEYKENENQAIKEVYLHNHENYEIYTFLEGNINFFVEGNAYHLQPYDMLIIRDHEMHQAVHLNLAKYRRIVMYVDVSIFKELDCEQYMKTFLDRKLGTSNLIKGENVKSTGLWDAIMRLQKYAAESRSTKDEVIVRAQLVEILYLLNRAKTESSDMGVINSEIAKRIIGYIDNNITRLEGLDEIAEKFFISKCHLCRIFKSATGLTVNKYITNRRIIRVRDKCRQGYNICDACMEAGFGSYSNFYKIYIRETGFSPREGLKR